MKKHKIITTIKKKFKESKKQRLKEKMKIKNKNSKTTKFSIRTKTI
jgi:hypothetical protein